MFGVKDEHEIPATLLRSQDLRSVRSREHGVYLIVQTATKIKNASYKLASEQVLAFRLYLKYHYTSRSCL